MMHHRAAIIGLGMASPPHIQALQALRGRVEIAAAWSPDATRRRTVCQAHGIPEATSFDSILADRTIDLALVLTPPWTHLDLAGACARAGKHVILEKPVEATLERVEQLVHCCESAGVRLGIVFQTRFRPHYRLLHGLVHQGRLGRLLSVSASIRWWRPDSYYAEAGRGMRARDGGGVLLTQAIHTLDLLLGLAGPVEKVLGFHATTPLRRIDTEHVVAGAVRFARGALGVIDATTTAFPGSPERIELAGELGSAILQRSRLQVWFKNGETIDDEQEYGGGSGADPMGFSPVAHQALIEDMLDALDTGRIPFSDGRSALPVHRLIDALVQAD